MPGIMSKPKGVKEKKEKKKDKFPCPTCGKLFKDLRRHRCPNVKGVETAKVSIFDIIDVYSYAKKVEDFLSRIGGFQMFKAVRIGKDGKNRGSPGNAAMFAKILEETQKVMAICRQGGVPEDADYLEGK